MRYVVRNNFFGLENRPPKQNGIKDKVTAASPTGEHEGRQEKPSEEARALSTSAEDCSQEDIGTSKAVVVNQYLHTCSEPSKDPAVDSGASAEQVAGYLIQNAEEKTVKDCHGLNLTGTDKITSTSNIYDDEIWESPGAVM